ncbi:membrane protein of unknown function [Tenacibaculum jejuense]|uniref:Uncharacterized protein n=1 Tax=Tenacibaculum jejuense TaxID=584609 RepID=A0A238UF32_9FLAO|nr:membrane protein of unknown function [Tenacibaculum jejuense]
MIELNLVSTYFFDKVLSTRILLFFALISIVFIVILINYYSFLERKEWDKNKHYIDYSKILFRIVNFISLVIIFNTIMSFETILKYSDILTLPCLLISIFYFNYYRKVSFKIKRKLKSLTRGTSIYRSSKNIFLIEKIEYTTDTKTEQNLSPFSKLLLFTFITIIILTPIHKLLGIDYFI